MPKVVPAVVAAVVPAAVTVVVTAAVTADGAAEEVVEPRAQVVLLVPLVPQVQAVLLAQRVLPVHRVPPAQAVITTDKAEAEVVVEDAAEGVEETAEEDEDPVTQRTLLGHNRERLIYGDKRYIIRFDRGACRQRQASQILPRPSV